MRLVDWSVRLRRYSGDKQPRRIEDKLDSRRLGSQLITLRMDAPPSSKRVSMNMWGWLVWPEDSWSSNMFRECELAMLRWGEVLHGNLSKQLDPETFYFPIKSEVSRSPYSETFANVMFSQPHFRCFIAFHGVQKTVEQANPAGLQRQQFHGSQRQPTSCQWLRKMVSLTLQRVNNDLANLNIAKQRIFLGSGVSRDPIKH